MMRQLAIFIAAFLGISAVSTAVPVYLAPDRVFPSGHYNRDWLKEHTHAQTTQTWLRVRAASGIVGWVLKENLLNRADLMNGALAYVKTRSDLKAKKILRAETLAAAEAGEKVEILESEPQWVRVRTDRASGYLPRQNLILATDIPDAKSISVNTQIPLLKKAQPSATSIGKLAFLESAKVLSSLQVEWGHLTARNGHELWWPMNETSDEVSGRQLLSSQLFKRRVFDMASSPTNANLKMASARGIFRTSDGQRWTQLPQFNDQDYPIVITETGRVFVGPYFSDDNAQTFTEYIRWDKLLAGISKLKHRREQREFKILEIKPAKNDSEKLSVLLDIGNSEKVSAETDDFGRTWSVK